MPSLSTNSPICTTGNGRPSLLCPYWTSPTVEKLEIRKFFHTLADVFIFYNTQNYLIMKRLLMLSVAAIISFVSFQQLSAQLKYKEGAVFIGNERSANYSKMTTKELYFGTAEGTFFRIDAGESDSPHLAGHNNMLSFHNTKTNTFNAIRVSRVFNYSDARAKTGIRTLDNGLDIIAKLRPVSYNFYGGEARVSSYNQFTGSNTELGLIAQEVEKVLPNLIYTDDEGRKFIDYTALIPALIDAVKTLQQEVEALKNNK